MVSTVQPVLCKQSVPLGRALANLFAKIRKIHEYLLPLCQVLEILGFEQHCSLYILAEHRCKFYSAHHGLRLRHLHHDDAAVPYADVWRGHNTLRTVGYHNLCSYCVAVAELCHMEQALADSTDVYHCLDRRHLCPDTHRRPYPSPDSWCCTYPD